MSLALSGMIFKPFRFRPSLAAALYRFHTTKV